MPLLIAIPLMLGLLLLRRRPGLLLRFVLLGVGLVAVASLAAVVIGTLVLVGGTGVAILVALALLLRPWRKRRIRPSEAVVENRAAPLFRGGVRRWWRRERTATPDPLADAWQQLSIIAPWSSSRVNAARTSIARLIAATEARPLVIELVEWSEVARRRVPELVERCREGLATRPPAEAHAWIDAHFDLIEAVAAEADRRVSRHRPAGADIDLATHRAWLAQHLQPTPLSPI